MPQRHAQEAAKAKKEADAAEKAHQKARQRFDERKRVLEQLSAAEPRDKDKISKAENDMKAAEQQRRRMESLLAGAKDKCDALDRAAMTLEMHLEK